MIPLRPPFTETCAEAIFRGNPVISNDIVEDMRFDLQWRTLCLGAGLKSLHSVPICEGGHPAEGTFVVGYRHQMSDDAWNVPMMELFADLASQAIKLYRSLGGENAARYAFGSLLADT